MIAGRKKRIARGRGERTSHSRASAQKTFGVRRELPVRSRSGIQLSQYDFARCLLWLVRSPRPSRNPLLPPSNHLPLRSSLPHTANTIQTQPVALDPPAAKAGLTRGGRTQSQGQEDGCAKNKVYTEDDLKGHERPGVSGGRRSPKERLSSRAAADPDDDNGTNTEAYWRDRARQFLDAIAQTDEQLPEKGRIRKFWQRRFDVTTGMKDNIGISTTGMPS